VAEEREGAAASPLVDARDVTFGYGRTPVLERVSLQIRPGEFVALVGPNGSGKSTLLKILLGALTPQRGSVALFGLSPAVLHERWRLGYVPQRPSLASEVPATVEEIVAAGRLRQGGWWHRLSTVDRDEVRHALESVGLDALGDRPLNELSAGQQQRAFIARA